MSGALARFLISIMLKIGDIVNADRMILRIYKARPALQEEMSFIQEKLNVLSSRAGIKPPTVYITELPLPGSFIIGRNPNVTSLVFPKRLLNLMKPDQIEAMLAYNLVQIDENIRIRTLVALVASLLTMSSSTVRWGAVFTGFGDYDDPAPRLLGMFVMGLVAPPAAAMIDSVKEKELDARAADLVRNPDALISAIEHLERNNVNGYPSLGFLCIVDPQRENLFEKLFQTHPSIEKRIRNIAGIRR